MASLASACDQRSVICSEGAGCNQRVTRLQIVTNEYDHQEADFTCFKTKTPKEGISLTLEKKTKCSKAKAQPH